MRMTDPSTAPLRGIRVLDLSRIIAGPFCTMQLADLGADVIKLEHPERGDDTRNMRPPEIGGEAHFFLAFNRNKRSIAINLATGEGQALVDRLAGESDVLVENFRPGVMRRLGLDYESMAERHPELIYCSVSGYGQSGSMADRPGLDPVLQAEAGMMSITGPPAGDPTRHPLSIVDVTTAFYATTAILAALLRPPEGHRGQHIDVSLFDSAVALTSNLAQYYFAAGEDPPRHGNGHSAAVPVGLFHAGTGSFYMALGNDRLFETLCREVIDRPEFLDDARFHTNAARNGNRGALEALLEEIFATEPQSHWLEKMRAAGLPAGPVRSLSQSLESAEVAERGMVETLEHPSAGEIRLLASPMRLSESPVVETRPPPTLGQHTDEVLGQLLGLDQAALERLRREKVIT